MSTARSAGVGRYLSAATPLKRSDEGFLYLAGVRGRCTRNCVGWAMGGSLATTLPLAALEMALQQRQDGKLLEQPQTRADPRTHLRHARRSKAAIFEWIEAFYNPMRLHSALGHKSPVDFEQQLN